MSISGEYREYPIGEKPILLKIHHRTDSNMYPMTWNYDSYTLQYKSLHDVRQYLATHKVERV